MTRQEFTKKIVQKYDGLSKKKFYAKVKSLCENLVITEADLNEDYATCWIEDYPDNALEAMLAVILSEAISLIVCDKIHNHRPIENPQELCYIVPADRMHLNSFRIEEYMIDGNARLFLDNYNDNIDMEYLSEICYYLIDKTKCWGLTENWKAIDLSINDNFFLLPRK